MWTQLRDKQITTAGLGFYKRMWEALGTILYKQMWGALGTILGQMLMNI